MVTKKRKVLSLVLSAAILATSVSVTALTASADLVGEAGQWYRADTAGTPTSDGSKYFILASTAAAPGDTEITAVVTSGSFFLDEVSSDAQLYNINNL